MQKNITFIHVRHPVAVLPTAYTVSGKKLPSNRIIRTDVVTTIHKLREKELELSPKGGVTIAIISTPKQVMIRFAKCQPTDNYCRKVGRRRALREVNRYICTKEEWDGLCQRFPSSLERVSFLHHDRKEMAKKLPHPPATSEENTSKSPVEAV